VRDEYRYIISGEAPTTVEAPYEDVTLGVRNAIREVEELTGRRILSEEGIMTPCKDEKDGVDLYLTTSSAGGGLQMVVAGAVRMMTAESAERAALGAGAICMDVISTDDGRQPYERIQMMRALRPDMIMISGGTDGGSKTHVIEIVETVKAADPKARLGAKFKLPVVYAGNKSVVDEVKNLLDKEYALMIVDNVRPQIDVENSEPARNAIHHLFMEHVMSHAPGYDKLAKWTNIPIMPTPMGEGTMITTIAETRGENVLGVGLGGATTNVYSVFNKRFVRTVSANFGMSYSVCNVLKEAGVQNITRWVPIDVDQTDVIDRLRNKMIRPTTIPETLDDLMIEHAVAREAIRLGFRHHKLLARELRGVKEWRGVDTLFSSTYADQTYIDMLRIDTIAGTGGLLSHAPRRAQSALILIDSFQPEGVTKLAQDSVFMMPHLGILSTVQKNAAVEIFEKDCLVKLGTCIAPRGTVKEGENMMNIKAEMPDGSTISKDIQFGNIEVIPLREGESIAAEIRPARGCNVGAGSGSVLKKKIEGGAVGIIVDGRGRPLPIPEDATERKHRIQQWITSMNAYPSEFLQGGK
jgi:uncharacterized protein (TIGR01319 family)